MLSDRRPYHRPLFTKVHERTRGSARPHRAPSEPTHVGPGPRRGSDRRDLLDRSKRFLFILAEEIVQKLPVAFHSLVKEGIIIKTMGHQRQNSRADLTSTAIAAQLHKHFENT